ncbi:MAG: HU family DNA-binding protein [Tannerellaceae bacterium]
MATTKEQLVKIIATECGTTTNSANNALAAINARIIKILIEESEVRLPQLGRLVLKDIAARNYRNPQNGAVVEAAAHKKVAFKVAPSLMEEVNNK